MRSCPPAMSITCIRTGRSPWPRAPTDRRCWRSCARKPASIWCGLPGNVPASNSGSSWSGPWRRTPGATASCWVPMASSLGATPRGKAMSTRCGCSTRSATSCSGTSPRAARVFSVDVLSRTARTATIWRRRCCPHYVAPSPGPRGNPCSAATWRCPRCCGSSVRATRRRWRRAAPVAPTTSCAARSSRCSCGGTRRRERPTIWCARRSRPCPRTPTTTSRTTTRGALRIRRRGAEPNPRSCSFRESACSPSDAPRRRRASRANST